MDLNTLLWAVAALLALAVAMRTRSLSAAPIAAAAGVAFVAGLLGEGLVVSLFLFALVAALGHWVVRPAVRSAEEDEPRTRAGTGSLVGRPGVVVERIANMESVGSVRIDDEIWNARSWEDGIELAPGTRIHVVELRGATAVVSS